MPTRRARPGSPTVAIGYLRASTDDQRLSPEAQRAAIVAWAERAGVQVASWHCDAGVSGAADLDERPELAAALVALRAHGAGLLAIARRDRLARDVALAAAVERAAAQAGARVVTADGVAAGDGPADALLRTLLDGVAQYERALIRSRTRAALAVKRTRGEFCGGEPPYGWRAGPDGRLEEHPGERAVVAQVRALRAAGLSLRAIVAELARVGVVARTGRPLALTQVARLAREAA